jgi:hypothetical protein
MALVQGGPCGVGPRRFLAEGVDAFDREGVDGVADGASGAGQIAGDL